MTAVSTSVLLHMKYCSLGAQELRCLFTAADFHKIAETLYFGSQIGRELKILRKKMV